MTPRQSSFENCVLGVDDGAERFNGSAKAVTAIVHERAYAYTCGSGRGCVGAAVWVCVSVSVWVPSC